MKLKETIRKVLREEEKKKDLSVPIKKLVDLYMENHKDKKYVCGYKFGMGKFATRHTGEVYQRFKITILFNSGYGSKRWPMTMAINTQEEEIMNELQDLILDTFGVIVDMHSTQTPNCEKIEESVLKEEATDTEYAVIEILKPSSRMQQKWYFQAVPLHKTRADKIYIKRGSSGILTISTKNIKVLKVFKGEHNEDMKKYLKKVREDSMKENITESEEKLPSLTAGRTSLERYAAAAANSEINKNNISDNFYGVVADIYRSNYGMQCQLTILMKKPFGGDDSDAINYMSRHAKNSVKSILGSEFDSGVTLSISTIDNYLIHKDYYDSKKNNKYNEEDYNFLKKNEMKEGELTEKCWKGYTQKGMKTMFGKRYPNCVKKKK